MNKAVIPVQIGREPVPEQYHNINYLSLPRSGYCGVLRKLLPSSGARAWFEWPVYYTEVMRLLFGGVAAAWRFLRPTFAPAAVFVAVLVVGSVGWLVAKYVIPNILAQTTVDARNPPPVFVPEHGKGRVAALLPLSGPSAKLATSLRDGIIAGLTAYNEVHGQESISYAVLDSAGVSDGAVHQLSNIEDRNGLCAVFTGSAAESCAVAAMLNGAIPTVQMLSGADTPETCAGVFQVLVNQARQQHVLAQSLASLKPGLAVTCVEGPGGVYRLDEFKRAYTDLGGAIAREWYLKEWFLTPALYELAQARLFGDAYGLVVPGYLDLSSEQLAPAKPSLIVVPGLVTAVGLEGFELLYTPLFPLDAASMTDADVLTLYRLLGEDTAGVVIRAIVAARFVSAGVADELRSTRDYVGTFGPLSFDERGHAIRPLSVYHQDRDGQVTALPLPTTAASSDPGEPRGP